MAESQDSFDPPGWEPVPLEYAAGVRAIYAYQAGHRGKRLKKIMKKVGRVEVIDHDGIRFIPDSYVPMYVPEGREEARFVYVKMFGFLLALASAVATSLPDRFTDPVLRAGPLAWLGIGATVVVLFVLALNSDDRRVRSLEARAIWVQGVFLFPDALLVRRSLSDHKVVKKKDIVRFCHEHLFGDSNNMYATHAVVFDEGGESKIPVVDHTDTTQLMEEWRTA